MFFVRPLEPQRALQAIKDATAGVHRGARDINRVSPPKPELCARLGTIDESIKVIHKSGLG
jgi:hypothetical protein